MPKLKYHDGENWQSIAPSQQEFDDLKQEVNSHKNEMATGAHKAKNIAIEDAGGHFTSTDVEGALNELFTFVSDGKNLIAAAITDKGVQADGSETFLQLADKIEQIKRGDYSIGDFIPIENLAIGGIDITDIPRVWSFTASGYPSTVNAIAVDSDGYVYSGSNDGTLRKISPTGQQIWIFTGNIITVYAVAVGEDGYVYSADNTGTIRKISPTGEEVWSFTGHTSTVYAIAVDSDGYVYSGSDDKTLRKISPTGEEVWAFTGHTSGIRTVAVGEDGYVYSAGRDRTVRKISPTGKEVWSFTGHTSIVYAIAVDSDGYVYSGGDDRTLRKISPTGEEVWVYLDNGVSTVFSLAVDSDGYVYIGADVYYDVLKISPTGEKIWEFRKPSKVISAIAVDTDGYVYCSFDTAVIKIMSVIKIIA